MLSLETGCGCGHSGKVLSATIELNHRRQRMDPQIELTCLG